MLNCAKSRRKQTLWWRDLITDDDDDDDDDDDGDVNLFSLSSRRQTMKKKCGANEEEMSLACNCAHVVALSIRFKSRN